jgi:hypothetical protein
LHSFLFFLKFKIGIGAVYESFAIGFVLFTHGSDFLAESRKLQAASRRGGINSQNVNLYLLEACGLKLAAWPL